MAIGRFCSWRNEYWQLTGSTLDFGPYGFMERFRGLTTIPIIKGAIPIKTSHALEFMDLVK